MPSLKLIYHVVYGQAKDYLNKAGTFILAAAILIWFASNYPKHPELETQYAQKIEQVRTVSEKQHLKGELQAKLLEKSYLGEVGKWSEPFFAPLGFDWKMSVSLEAGLAAKEVIVSTLGVLYALGDKVDETSHSLQQRLREQVPLPAAVAFIVFVMIYIPCMASMAVFVREAGGWRYLGYLFVMTTGTAWLLSFVAYNATRMLM
jgi:ferrous iron transport protein B